MKMNLIDKILNVYVQMKSVKFSKILRGLTFHQLNSFWNGVDNEKIRSSNQLHWHIMVQGKEIEFLHFFRYDMHLLLEAALQMGITPRFTANGYKIFR